MRNLILLVAEVRARRPAHDRFLGAKLNALLCSTMLLACSSATRDDPGTSGAATGGAGGSSSVSVGAAVGGGVACDETVYQGQTLASDLLLVFNGSGIREPSSETRKSVVQVALDQFTESPEVAGVGFAVSEFPRALQTIQVGDCSACNGANALCGTCTDVPDDCKDQPDPDPGCLETSCSCTEVACAPADYHGWNLWLGPSTDFATLPGEDHYLWSTMADTAMAPAMSGAMESLTGWALNHHEQNAAIVLASQSEAASGPCTGGTAEVAQTVAAAASSKAAIRTYVIALGSVPALDAIAVAGGSVAAQSVSEPDLATALTKVVRQMRGCAYSIPVPSTGSFDAHEVNVRVQGAGDDDMLAQVPNAAACAEHQGGWYYDDPNDPRKILLCHESCADLAESSTGIDVLLGCPTVEAPK